MPEEQISVGTKRGRLAFIERAGYITSPAGSRFHQARFRCDCGKDIVAALRHWKAGSIVSCGCGRSEALRRHGMAKTPLHNAWKGMRARTRPALWAKRPNYTGVKYDPLWETFEGFMANQPTTGRPFAPGLCLSRIGDVGDYTPQNTRWVTKGENSREARFHGRHDPNL